MPQVFPKSANPWSRASLVGVLFLVLGLGWMIAVIQRSDYVTTANTFREQPVQFSHQHHVGGIGIDCRYCHTSVEVASSAGIPPTKTCINCHSQIWSTSPYLEPVRASFREDKPLRWIRVHDLPDFVYFNHSIHVTKGVGCETCHGRVDQMPKTVRTQTLSMGWCLDCHRDPTPQLRRRDAVFAMGWSAHDKALPDDVKAFYQAATQRLTSCNTCHR